MSYWRGKVVVITGGSAGLGRALADAFAAQGAQVVVVARGEAALGEAVEAITARGQHVASIAADITQDADVDRLFSQVIEQHGRLDALVNCAGVSARAAVLDTTPEQFQAMWEINLLALVRCTRAATPHLLKSSGHLVNIGSLAAKIASRYLGAYPATKHAVAAYSQQLRLELGPQGLHVLLVCPGPIARADAGRRYAATSPDIPADAQQPGGGAKVKSIDPDRLATQILKSCERRKPELVIPGRARLLFTLAQLSPRLGDWLLEKMTSGQ
jgi:short-subunit dehydrogenase